MKNFEVYVGTEKVDTIDMFTFNGGEEHVKIKESWSYGDNPSVTIKACLESSQNIMQLAMLKDAIDRNTEPSFVSLEMGYVPYARQDRVCAEGEALSIKVFCDMINAMAFDEVVIVDPHSDVTPALLDYVRVVEQHQVWGRYRAMNSDFKMSDGDVIVVPDAGASKKSMKVAQALGFTNLVVADKVRDVNTGKITSTRVYDSEGKVKGKRCHIFDDICDGGYTFIQLTKELKALGASSVTLYVTHGIFSKGLYELKASGIDKVVTTNTLNQEWAIVKHLEVFKL